MCTTTASWSDLFKIRFQSESKERFHEGTLVFGKLVGVTNKKNTLWNFRSFGLRQKSLRARVSTDVFDNNGQLSVVKHIKFSIWLLETRTLDYSYFLWFWSYTYQICRQLPISETNTSEARQVFVFRPYFDLKMGVRKSIGLYSEQRPYRMLADNIVV